jgi:hypothetical protein
MKEIGFSPTPLHKLILYVLKGIGREVGRIELAKILYLVDAEKVRLLGSTLTGEEYTRQKLGPLSRNFSGAIEDMDGNEIVVKIHPGFMHPKHEHTLSDTIRFSIDLSPEDALIANRVINQVKDKSVKEIEHMAYETEPMRAILDQENKLGTRLYGEPVDFSLIKLDPRMKRWRENKSKYEQKPDKGYEEFFAEERQLGEEILSS